MTSDNCYRTKEIDINTKQYRLIERKIIESHFPLKKKKKDFPVKALHYKLI